MEGRKITTVRQTEMLLEFLEQHRDLALGRVRAKEARVSAARLWRECTLILNAEGPPRTFKQWPKVWNDLKCKVRAKLININASQQATGGGPSSAATLTPLEERVASILGRDIGPLPNVRQDHFAIHDDDGIGVAEEVVEEVMADSAEPLVYIRHYSLQNVEAHEPSILVARPSPTPSITGQIPLSPSTQNEGTIRARQQQRRRGTARQSTARIPPAQSNRSVTALDESRSTVLKIELLKAEVALITAQAAKTYADGFTLIAGSVDRFSRSVDRFTRVYTQQHARASGAEDNENQ